MGVSFFTKPPIYHSQTQTPVLCPSHTNFQNLNSDPRHCQSCPPPFPFTSAGSSSSSCHHHPILLSFAGLLRLDRQGHLPCLCLNASDCCGDVLIAAVPRAHG